MGDAVTTRTLFAGTKRYIQQYTNTSDGTGESAVQKLDISALLNANGDAITSVSIDKIWGNLSGMSVNILTHHTSNVLMQTVAGSYVNFDFTSFGGKKDTGTGETGDILFTTVGHTNGDTYDITVQYRLS